MPDVYRTKPDVVEAVQWLPGDMSKAGEMIGWLMGYGTEFHCPGGMGETTTLAIETPEGEETALPGDWIVKSGVLAFRVCDPITFDARYEPANGDPG